MKKIIFLMFLSVLILGSERNIFAEEVSQSSLFVPLIGITSVPDPLSLPKGEGNVNYNYAVKNFLRELPLTNIKVSDDKCPDVKFLTGDDNNDSNLDYGETWRYFCTTKVSVTTENAATAVGNVSDITATHKAYSTVIVGSNDIPPIVSIINITKLSYPISLPEDGGKITFIYKVSNPGIIPLGDLVVVDDKCVNMSGKLGDTNGNNLLDVDEAWIYTCATILQETTTNTVTVEAYANGLRAFGSATITVKVDKHNQPITGFPAQAIPGFPDTGLNNALKFAVWITLLGILITLIIFFVYIDKNKKKHK